MAQAAWPVNTRPHRVIACKTNRKMQLEASLLMAGKLDLDKERV